MLHSVKLAYRSLARSRGFTAVAILTLALGIGMNTAMFSLLNGFLLRPLSYPHSEKLFRLDRITPQNPQENHASANFLDLAKDTTDFAELAAYRFWAFTVSETGQPPDVPVAASVTLNFFKVLGTKVALGRGFLPGEDQAGKDQVVLISNRYWQKRFNGAADVIGRVVRLDGTPARIIGVLPASDDAARWLGPVGLYRPFVFTNEEKTNRKDASLGVIGRYHNGMSTSEASARFDTLAQHLAADHPAENAGMKFGVRSLQSTSLSGPGRTMTFLLVGLSGFVLLIACANLANLLLARTIARAREFSIRAALGASRSHLLKPLFAECLLLAGAGGAAAILVSAWTTEWLGHKLSGDPTDPLNFPADTRVLLFTLFASIATALLFGVGPAWWAVRADLNSSLKSGSRGATETRAQLRYRQLLIVVQFALSLVLLAGAGFFIRGVQRLIRNEAGWNPSGLITGTLNLASAKYNSAEPIIAFHTALRNRLLELPGVENASVSFEEPLFTAPAQRDYLVEGRADPTPGKGATAYTNGVSASYFDTVGTRLLRGRLIDQTDQLKSRPVVVINDAMARALFPNGDALGHRLGVSGQAGPLWGEIVGIVEDVKPLQVRPSPIVFQVYKPFTQEAWQYVTIAVRAKDPALAPTLLDPIRKAVAALDPDQPVTNFMPAPERIEQDMNAWTTIDQLLILFSALGLLLAALGIYGVILRHVSQRTGEIGIRMALGAQMTDILTLVLGGGLRLAGTGVTIGLVGGIILGKFLTSEMPAFGGSAFAPVAIAGAVLAAVAMIASYLPARRATKVDPTVALRSE
ncbi:MAG TPA: ABC transporter permease [Lacunisphaera sp.]|jgi:predicted permease